MTAAILLDCNVEAKTSETRKMATSMSVHLWLQQYIEPDSYRYSQKTYTSKKPRPACGQFN